MKFMQVAPSRFGAYWPFTGSVQRPMGVSQ